MNLEHFKKCVLPVKNKLYRFAFKIMGDKEEAEDIVQEVLIKVWNNRDKMINYLNIEAWCMKLVKNQSLDRLKSRQYKTALFKEDFEVETDHITPYQSMELGDQLKNIRMIIDTLPEKQKQIIHLRDMEGFSYQEIAEILEIDMTQVKVYLFRARNTIKTKLLNVEAYGTK